MGLMSSPNSCILFVATAVIVIFGTAEAQYEDVRCLCICPRFNNNGSLPSPEVYLDSFADSQNCNCHTVVPESERKDPKFCANCECEWQRRNTTTIKVVVFIVICVVSLLVLYMLFLLCLDPLMSHRPKSYLEQQNEEDTQSLSRIIPESSRPTTGVISRVRHEVNRVKGEQEKWKGTVQEQRKNIYDRRTMLN